MVGGTTQSDGSDWLSCQSGGVLAGHLMVTAFIGAGHRSSTTSYVTSEETTRC